MKEFKDLEFMKRDVSIKKIARVSFDNGYGVSVIPYGNNGKYEIAVLKDGDLCYDTPITSDVIGDLSEEEVTSYMKEIQQLPNIVNPESTIKMKLSLRVE